MDCRDFMWRVAFLRQKGYNAWILFMQGRPFIIGAVIPKQWFQVIVSTYYLIQCVLLKGTESILSNLRVGDMCCVGGFGSTCVFWGA